MHPEELLGHIVVAIGEQAVLHEEGKAAIVASHAEQHPLGAGCGHVDLHRDRVGSVENPRGRIKRHHLGAWVIDVALPVGGNLGTLDGKTLGATAINRQHLVFARLHIPHANHGDQAVPLSLGQVGGFGEVGVEVV